MKTSNNKHIWNFSSNRIQERRSLPSLYRPVGFAVWECEMSLSFEKDECVIFTCPGILGKGELWINGAYVSPLYSQGQNRVDITKSVKKGINQIQVSLFDLAMPVCPVGMTAAGIPGEISLEILPSLNVSDVYLTCDSLEAKFFQGRLHLETSQDGEGTASLISANGITVWQANFLAQEKKAVLPVTLPFPEIWSLDTPSLYTLQVETSGQTAEFSVGLRQISTDSKQFLLNGTPCFLKGVNRPGSICWKNDFPSLADPQQDLLAVKELGGSLIRCIGCPEPEFLDLCDKMGLLLAVGPGYPVPKDLSSNQKEFLLSELKNTVRTCRNHPSVALWVLAEGGELDVDYLKSAKSLVQDLDPERPSTMAATGRCEDIKKAFDCVGLDCYSYCADTLYLEETGEGEGLEQAFCTFQRKPLFLTQFGGHRLGANPNYYRSWWRAVCKGAAQGVLAGVCWKSLRNTPQYQIGKPNAINGWLYDGVLDSHGIRTEIFPALHRLFHSIGTELRKEPRICWQADSTVFPGIKFMPLALKSSIDTTIQEHAWELALKDHRRRQTTGTQYQQTSKLKGPSLNNPIYSLNGIDTDISEGLPILFSQEGMSTFEIKTNGLRVSEIHLFGMTCFTEAYPVFGAAGDLVLDFCLKYTDGSQKIVPLRNGYEFSSASLLHGSSLYDPRAIFSPPVYRFVWDEDWEHYQICHYCYSLPMPQDILLLRFQLQNNKYRPLLYGITVGITETE